MNNSIRPDDLSDKNSIEEKHLIKSVSAIDVSKLTSEDKTGVKASSTGIPIQSFDTLVDNMASLKVKFIN